MFRRSQLRRGAFLAVATLLLALAGCGDDDTETDEGARVDDVAALAGLLEDVGGGCTLEYEGLTDDQREVSICTLGEEVVELAVWTDLDALDELRSGTEGSGDPLVTGPNWSVDVTGSDLAEQVADATGGSVTS